MSFLRVLLILSVLLIFQEQYNFTYLLEKGIYWYHIIGAMAFICFLFLLVTKKINLQWNNLLVKAGFIFIIAVFVTCLFSKSISESFKCFSNFVFCASFGLMFYMAFLEISIYKIITILTVSTFLAASIGIYDIVALNCSFVTFSYNANPIQITSGFQHFGTAADYIQVMLSILIPFQISDYYKAHKKNIFGLATIFFGLLFLLGTGRVSVIISFMISLGLLLFINIKFIKIKKTIVAVAISILSIFLFFAFIPSFFQGIAYRVNSRVLDRQAHSLEADFFTNNIKAAFSIFQQNPIHGVGLGNAHFKLHEFDFSIHGTFCKLLSETGIVGFLGYIVFIIAIGIFTYRNIAGRKTFFYQFAPFLIGIFISSVYNTHFMRIEFWILLAMLLILSKKQKQAIYEL